MKANEIIELLMFIASVYQDRFKYPTGNEGKDTLTEEAWLEFLKPYDIDTVKRATKKLMNEGPKWPPTAPEISNEIINNKMPDLGTADDSWNYIHDKCTYTVKDLDENSLDPISQKALCMIGGKNMIGDTAPKSMPFLKKEFISIYNDLVYKANMEGRQLLSEGGRIEDIPTLNYSKNSQAVISDRKKGQGMIGDSLKGIEE